MTVRFYQWNEQEKRYIEKEHKCEKVHCSCGTHTLLFMDKNGVTIGEEPLTIDDFFAIG